MWGYCTVVLVYCISVAYLCSLIFCAMVMRHYIEPNLSSKSAVTTKYALKVVR